MRAMVAVVCLFAGCGDDDDHRGPPPACLADVFDGSQIDFTSWDPLEPQSPFALAIAEAHLEVTIPPNTTGENGLVSRGAYDLRDGSIYAEVPLTPTGPRVGAVVAIEIAGARYAVRLGDGMVVASAPGMADVVLGYDLSDRYIRFRHDGAASALVVEASYSPGATWTELRTIPAPATLDATLSLSAVADEGGNQAPGRAWFDDVRLTTAMCP